MFEHKEIASLNPNEKWRYSQIYYDPVQNLKNETLMTLGNGYTGVRGSLEEGAEPQQAGTFIAGVYDKANASAKTIVNLPNWLPLRLRTNNSLINPLGCEVLEFSRVLNLEAGLLLRSAVYRDPEGRETRVEGYRFVSIANPHRAALVTLVRPLNWSGELSVASLVDGGVSNTAEDGSREEHFKTVKLEAVHESGGAYMEVATLDTGIHIGIATETRVKAEEPRAQLEYKVTSTALERILSQEYSISVSLGESIRIEKLVTQFTSRDLGTYRESTIAGTNYLASSEASVEEAAVAELKDFQNQGVSKELEKHRAEFRSLWNVADIEILGDDEADRLLRFNIFHLLSCYTGDDPDVSIGAKGLHGEGYKGQIFWDSEIFLFPFYLYTRPSAAKSLLMYRYNRLDAARCNARDKGYNGALFPWNSADSGAEDSGATAITIAGDTIPWDTSTMLHVNAGIAYAVVQYCIVSEDYDFAYSVGIELLAETARFWASRVQLNELRGEYELKNVVGPDEFHLYIDNNFYTNAMAQWNLEAAARWILKARHEAPQAFADVNRRLQISDEEVASWTYIASKIRLNIDPETGIAEQFDGYSKLRNFQVSELDENRLPAWPDGVDLRKLHETQLIKQADVIHAMYLLGDRFDDQTKRVNYDHYLKRTVHRSTLSASTYALMALSLGEDSEAYQSFMRTIEADIIDSQGSAGQGIHIASSAGGWMAAVLGFGGLKISGAGTLSFQSHLPSHWERLRFRVIWHDQILEIDLSPDEAKVKRLTSQAEKQNSAVPILLNGQKVRC